MKKLPIIDQGGPFDLPDSHQPVVRTPKGGSSCANCHWLTFDGKHCNNAYYIEFMGTDELPGPADEVCSDWWEPQWFDWNV